MNVDQLIDDLIAIRDQGHGDAKVIVEEVGEGYFGDLESVDTLLGPEPWTLTLVSSAKPVPGATGMPAIVWSGENHSADRWLDDVRRVMGYNVEITLTDGEVVEGQIFKVGRAGGMPCINVMRDNIPIGSGHAVEYESEQISSIYVY